MTVLFVDLDREWRGGQSQAFLLLRGLREKGHAVELVAPRNAPLARRVSEVGIPVHEVSRSALRLSAAATLRRLLKSGRFNLLHANEPHALTAAWMAGAHRRMPLLLSRRIGFPLGRNAVSRARFRAVSCFVANCREVAQSLLAAGIEEKRIAIVNEGVEVPPPASPETRNEARKHWGATAGEFLFGCVGVFVPEKGQKHAIEALAAVRAEFPRARLLLAGDGPCRRDLEKLAKDLGQTEAVHFAGFLENVAQVYAALDAFVFPSEFEGLGTSLQAAMAWGLPSVSTACGGLAEVVADGRTALVAEPDGKKFAQAMLRLLRDERLRQSLGRAGREEIERRFSAALMVANTLRVYEDMLSERRPA
jgi:glycosyltransferase involved in cell wall biosynthesis